MKTTPKPRAVRPMKLWCHGDLKTQIRVMSSATFSHCKHFDHQRPVLVIDLSPESVASLFGKVQRAADKTELSRYPHRATVDELVMSILFAIGIKPARVAKRKKAK